MIDELNAAIQAYKAKWDALVAGRKSKEFFESLKPMSAGWKTVDQADFDNRFLFWRDHADTITMSWANERWLVTFHLKDEVQLALGMRLFILMQRRPNSADPVGLDHIDFYTPDRAWAEDIIKKEGDLKWSQEENGKYCAWTSLWFDGTEAKLRDNTKLDVSIAELKDLNRELLGQDEPDA
jgi:hypothetical protein